MSTTQPIRDPQLLKDFKDYYLHRSPNIRNYALCILGLNTALRITDMLNLKWKDIYRFDKAAFRPHLTIKEKKTGKQNTVALNQAVTDTMSLLFSSQPAAPCENGYIFVSRNGNNCPLSRYQAYRIIREAASNLGMQQHISCHSLRKTFGYYAWKQGTAPAMLMTIFNHSSYQITKRYLGIEQDDKDKVFLNISL
ncbi:MAG: tyrosine-type recombinase/integrase [Lachnospiraceae bacterium]|nr:tyrosine-type recombinase/integrase [Lachnospiraceae bacterium]